MAGIAAAVVVALAISGLGVLAWRSIAGRGGAAIPASAAGIHPGEHVPTLDANGDPVWVPVPFRVHPAAGIPLPAALTAAPGTGPVVTPAEAGAVLKAAWREREIALSSGNGGLLAELETGPALDADLNPCACAPTEAFGPITSSQVLVPAQTFWPAHFLGDVITTASGAPWIEYLVFQRGGPAQAWKVLLATGYEPAKKPFLDVPAPAQDGFDGLGPPDSVDPASLPVSLAADWQASKDGRPLPPSAMGPQIWTTDWGRTLARYGQGKVNAEIGLTGHYLYQADVARDGVYAFGASTYQIACGVVRVQKTWTPPPGGSIRQDLLRQGWGSTVAPGTYRAVITTQITEPCFFVQQQPYGVYVVGADEQGETAVGIP
jgi:hypothetical protein